MEEDSFYVRITGHLGIFSAAIGSIVVLYKTVIKPGYHWIRSASLFYDKLSEICDQFKPNGGGTIRDAIDRIELRQIVAESRHHALLLDANVGYWESDREGKCIWANKKYKNMLGLTIEGIQGNGWLSSVHLEQRDQVWEEWQNCVEQRREFIVEDLIYRTSDGVETRCFVRAYPLLDTKGEIHGWIGQATELSD